jgi:hypothetical protein
MTFVGKSWALLKCIELPEEIARKEVNILFIYGITRRKSKKISWYHFPSWSGKKKFEAKKEGYLKARKCVFPPILPPSLFIHGVTRRNPRKKVVLKQKKCIFPPLSLSLPPSSNIKSLWYYLSLLLLSFNELQEELFLHGVTRRNFKKRLLS